jgi:hypothetical protein
MRLDRQMRLNTRGETGKTAHPLDFRLTARAGDSGSRIERRVSMFPHISLKDNRHLRFLQVDTTVGVHDFSTISLISLNHLLKKWTPTKGRLAL